MLHAIVLGGFALVSLPALVSGSFGVDNDAWGVLSAALRTLETGDLHLSRSPGNIVHELAGLLSTAAVTRLGLKPELIPTLMSTYSFASAIAAYFLFFGLQRELRIPGFTAHVAAICLLGGPSVLIHAADGMDYLPALAFGLAAIRYRNASPWLVVLLFNLAVGNRLAMLLYCVPLALLYWNERAPVSRYTTLAVAIAAALGISLLVRLLAEPAPGTVGNTAADIMRIAGGIGFGWFGLAATLFMAAIAAVFVLKPALVAESGSERAAAGVRSVDGNITLIALAGLIPQLLLYAYVPNDPAYLTGAVPFALLLFAAFRLKPWVWLVLMACLLAANLYSIRGYDQDTRTARLYITPGPYPIALYEHHLPGNIFADFEHLALSAKPRDITLIVQQHGISNSFNARWGDLWQLHHDRGDIDIQFSPRRPALEPFTATQWREADSLYVLRKASPRSVARHSASDVAMKSGLRQICAREGALGHDIHLDVDYARFERACRAAAGRVNVSLYRIPSKDNRFDYSWMSF